MTARRRISIESAEPRQIIRLDTGESRHVLRVLRLRAGEQIEGVDGRGGVYTLELIDARAGHAQARVIDKRREEHLWPLDVTVAAALIKGARMDWAVEKAAELGARVFVPFASARTVVPGAEIGAKIDRWRRLANAVLKQSLGSFLMDVSRPRDFDYVVELTTRADRVLMADPEAGPLWLAPLVRTRRVSCLLVVGPEGGLSGDESLRLCEAGAVRFSLGAGRLRSETAVAAALATLWHAVQIGAPPSEESEGGR